MRYKNIIIAVGALIVLVQFLGFPSSADNALYIVFGLLVIALGYMSGKSGTGANL